MALRQVSQRSIDSFVRRLADEMAALGAGIAKKGIPSKTLKQGLQIVKDSDGDRVLYIPHFWAIYVHDGRGAIKMPKGSFMVFFRDPANDPRRQKGKTPVRANELRRLTQSEFQRGLELNRIARKVGATPYMYVTPYVKGVQGSFFFVNEGNMAPFVQQAKLIGRDRGLAFIRRGLGETLTRQKKTIRIRL